MTNNQIMKWLDDFHNDLENRTNKENLNMRQFLLLMPEECGRKYLEMGNETFGTDFSYDEIMNKDFGPSNPEWERR
tara:strand:+ start:536 stop:763 length:228 start_codon:yes stop_codon:yes gene_type:complete